MNMCGQVMNEFESHIRENLGSKQACVWCFTHPLTQCAVCARECRQTSPRKNLRCELYIAAHKKRCDAMAEIHVHLHSTARHVHVCKHMFLSPQIIGLIALQSFLMLHTDKCLLHVLTFFFQIGRAHV